MMGQAQGRPAAREPAAATRALWSALDAAATPASTLVTLAVLVRALGASDYGILVIAFAASGLSLAVNPAIAATTTKFVSELSGERQHGGRTVAGVITVSLMTVAAIDLVLLLGTAAFNEPLSLWVFGAALARTQNVGQVLLLAVLAIGLQQIEAVLAAAIRGLERFRRQALIEILSRAALTAVVTYVAWRSRSLEAILIAQCAVYVVSLLVRAVALRQLLPDKQLFELPGWAEARMLFRYSGWMWLTALAGVAYTSADRIIVGRSLGAAAAGQYNIYVQITQLIHFIPSSVFAFSFPAFSRLAARGNAFGNEIGQAYSAYLVAISMAALGIAAAMMLSWPLLLKIFAGAGSASGQFGAPLLLTLNFLLLACNVAPYYLLLALGHVRAVSMITTASMVAALALMTLLIPRYGLQGAALARLAYGIGALMLLRRAHRVLKVLPCI
jgi:O-antigen/teichoic acid export membrane protein